MVEKDPTVASKVKGGYLQYYSLLPLTVSFFAAVLGVFAEPPLVGKKAENFSLRSVDGALIQLSEVIAKSPVVLIILRGYPGYQCPFCQRQVQDFV